jgi:hypothetical protein
MMESISISAVSAMMNYYRRRIKRGSKGLVNQGYKRDEKLPPDTECYSVP